MKRTLVSVILFLIVISAVIVGAVMKKNNNNSDLTKVKVAEVAHSIFYAPQYVAISNGYFEEEGIEIDLTLTPGADAVMSAVLSGDVNIGFSGTEATIYVYNGGEEDYPVTFAALTKRDGAFLVSREKIDNFTLNDLKGKTVVAKTSTAGLKYAQSIKDKYGFKLEVVEESTFMFEKVKSGEAAACFEDYPVLKYMVKTGQLNFDIPCGKESPANYGFAVLKGENKELLKKFNKGLANLKKNGEYDKIVAKYE